MTQSAASADILSKASSMLSGLLSQMAGSAGTGGANNLFASLLGNGDAGDGNNALGAALDAQAQTQAQVQTQAQTAQSQNNSFAANNGTTTTADTFDASDGNSSSSDLMQNLLGAVRTLRAIVSNLQGHQSQAKAKSKNSTSDDQQDGAAAATTDSATTTATSGAPDASGDSSDPAKQVAAAIAQLLSLTQQMMQMLHQAAGGTLTGSASASGGDMGDQLLAGLQAAGSSGLNKALAAIAKDLQALSANSGAAQNAVSGDSGANATGNALLDLLQSIEKNALQITQELQSAGAASAVTAPTDNLSAQFATLDQTLKQIAADLEAQTGSTQAAFPSAKTAQKNADNLTVTLASMGTAGASDPSAKSAVPDVVQNRLYPLTATPAPSSHAQAAAQAQLQAQQSAQQAQTQETAAQTQATTVNASILAAAAKDSAGSDGDDMLSDHQSGFSAANPAATDTTGGENVSAVTGYNSFATALSSVRAAPATAANMPSAADQVILQLNRSIKNGNDQLTLQLHPADMGKITVKLDMGSDGKVQGTVTADNPKTLDMLQKDSRSLERALQDAGLRADSGSLQFNLGQQQDQGQAGQASDGQNAESGAGDGTINASEDLQLVDTSSLPEIYYVSPTGVNIRV